MGQPEDVNQRRIYNTIATKKKDKMTTTISGAMKI